MSIDDSVNFRRVDERLTTSGRVSTEQLASLGGEGYECVINLLPDESEHAVADEAGILRARGIDYVHIPVDFAAPTHADFEAFAAAMDAHAHETVHVHCAANYRVTAFYRIYASRQSSTGVDAEALMRSVWDPDEHPAWTAFLARELAAQ